MKATDVVRTILAEHAALRDLLSEARSLAVSFPEGAMHVGRELRQVVDSFMAHAHSHFELEETHWVPLMKQAGLWTPERAQRLEADHAYQRGLLEKLQREGRGSAGPEFARAVVSLADTFSTESDCEDKDIDARRQRVGAW